jgi:polyferredoxin
MLAGRIGPWLRIQLGLQSYTSGMGVSVRLSRNTRVYVPFWLAIPLWVASLAIWLAILVFTVIAWLFEQGVRGYGRLISRRQS